MNQSKLSLLTPRHFWLKQRVLECTEALTKLELGEEWEIYKNEAKNLAYELLYAVTEWDKYYRDEE